MLREEQARRSAEIRASAADHLRRYLSSGGEDGHLVDGRRVLILTTTGRRSGEPRHTPLFFCEDGDRYVLVGSFGGSPTPPAWYLNLCAQPSVGVQVKDRSVAATAYTASGEERERLWQLMHELFPLYADYQAESGRTLPVVVLEPAAGTV